MRIGDQCGSIARCAVLAILIFGGTVRAALEESADTRKRPALPPQMEAKLAEIAKKFTDAKRKLMEAEMKQKAEEVVQATGLNEDGRKALENAGAQAVDQCLKDSDGHFEDLMRAQFSRLMPGQLEMVLKQMNAQIGTTARFWRLQDESWPTDQQAWKDGLAKTLNGAQAAAWEKAEATRMDAAKKEMGEYMKTVVRLAGDDQRGLIEPKVGQVQQVLNLPKDRLEKLNALAESMIARNSEAIRAKNEKRLLAMGDEERKDLISRSGYTWSAGKPAAEWDDALAKLLTPDEMKRLQAAREERKTRRVHAMGEILVTLLDEKIAFTDAQRQQLGPIAEQLVKKRLDLFPDQEANNYFMYSLQTFYSAAGNASADEVKAILDPIQWQHWQDVSTANNEQDDSFQQFGQPIPPPDDPNKLQPAPEPEDGERAVSDFLEAKSSSERETILAANLLKAEDIARVAQLPADAAERLQTAARGAAEESLAGWNASVEQVVRSNIGDAAPENVKQRLASIQGYQFQSNFLQRANNGSALQESVWDKTLKTVLSPDQEAAWKKETDARAAYRGKARRHFGRCSRGTRHRTAHLALVQEYP